LTARLSCQHHYPLIQVELSQHHETFAVTKFFAGQRGTSRLTSLHPQHSTQHGMSTDAARHWHVWHTHNVMLQLVLHLMRLQLPLPEQEHHTPVWRGWHGH
jgi:hypothetical protein